MRRKHDESNTQSGNRYYNTIQYSQRSQVRKKEGFWRLIFSTKSVTGLCQPCSLWIEYSGVSNIWHTNSVLIKCLRYLNIGCVVALHWMSKSSWNVWCDIIQNLYLYYVKWLASAHITDQTSEWSYLMLVACAVNETIRLFYFRRVFPYNRMTRSEICSSAYGYRLSKKNNKNRSFLCPFCRQFQFFGCLLWFWF